MGIEKKWVVKEQGNPASVRQLAQELGIDSVLANLLVQRGIGVPPLQGFPTLESATYSNF